MGGEVDFHFFSCCYCCGYTIGLRDALHLKIANNRELILMSVELCGLITALRFNRGMGLKIQRFISAVISP